MRPTHVHLDIVMKPHYVTDEDIHRDMENGGQEVEVEAFECTKGEGRGCIKKTIRFNPYISDPDIGDIVDIVIDHGGILERFFDRYLVISAMVPLEGADDLCDRLMDTGNVDDIHRGLLFEEVGYRCFIKRWFRAVSSTDPVDEQLNHEALKVGGSVRAEWRIRRLVDVLRPRGEIHCIQAMEDLVEMGPDAVEPLCQALLEDTEPGPLPRRHIVWTLGQIGDVRAVDPLLEFVGRSGSGAVAVMAAPSLARIGEPALKKLVKALSDVEDDVVSCAAIALGMIRDDRAVDPLLKALCHDSEDVRGHVITALGLIDDPVCVERLVEMVRNEDIPNRSAAFSAMGRSALRNLLKLLDDPDPDIRRGAVETLGRIGDVSVAGRLRERLSDGDRYVRAGAARVLNAWGEDVREDRS